MQRARVSIQRWLFFLALALVLLIVLFSPHGSGDRAVLAPGAGPPASVANAKLAIPVAAQRDNPIACASASGLPLATELQMVGSIAYDSDRYAVVGPLVSGRIARLLVGVGDHVRAGQVLCEIESAEIGQAQADFLAASAHAVAASANLARERELAAQHISSARERELAEAQAKSEAAAEQAAIERLRAFGLGKAELDQLRAGRGTGGRVPLRAPISGTVVSREVALGQAVEHATDAFEIADLGRLWVLLDLYEKDLAHVHAGQRVELRTEALPGRVFDARVAYVSQQVDHKTRTANVRIELENAGGALRPGQFVSAKMVGDARPSSDSTTSVPRRAVAVVEGDSLVFVCADDGYERRKVELGRVAGDAIEIRAGLVPGERVVTDGTFLLKSELLR